MKTPQNLKPQLIPKTNPHSMVHTTLTIQVEFFETLVRLQRFSNGYCSFIPEPVLCISTQEVRKPEKNSTVQQTTKPETDFHTSKIS